MCKTCDISETMLSVVAETKQISYERINLNFYTRLIEYYQIRSAPALLLFKNGELVKEVYAFQSVPYLNEVLEEFLFD
ncbi:thioredoxin family protein [Jeotgalicoccus sp. WY2]|uniref:thioredoxin family protein n=1 Tax=Jeotgalicoccus sp. WY2 TaxID=2708346 RepID=UPI00202256C7|nr:thioredoxin family protein [Jeotgalicoccus sp. WY2]